MENKFTPGEWWYSNLSSELFSMPDQVKIAKNISGSTESEANYNRALIEKSPRLFEALYAMTKEFSNVCFQNRRNPQDYEQYNSAITLINQILKNGDI